MKCALFVEWNALYTTQLTQKAKKYHDGILRLMQIGSHARQVRNWCHYFIYILIITTLREQILTKIDIIVNELANAILVSNSCIRVCCCLLDIFDETFAYCGLVVVKNLTAIMHV
jgi:hypothetical protein